MEDCGGIGHNVEECRKKRYDLVVARVKPMQVWVTKKQAQPTVIEKQQLLLEEQ